MAGGSVAEYGLLPPPLMRCVSVSQMATEELSIKGLTGVDLSLQVAGLGTRAYAFIIDWHIRLLLVLAWVLVGFLVSSPFPSAAAAALWLLVFLVPGLIVYFFYHPVVELLMHGRTPGKRMAGARIVTLEGATPGAGAILLRNLFRVIDALPMMYVVGLVCCMLTRQHVRIGDLAAGTILVLDKPQGGRSLGDVGALAQNARLAPETAALVRDLLDRWTEMHGSDAEALARTLIVRLEHLDPGEVGQLDQAALRARLEGLLAT